MRLQSQAERCIRPLSLSPRSGANNQNLLPEYVAKLDDLQRRLQKLVVKYENHIDKVETWLSGLAEQQAIVMRHRYVNGYRWGEISRRTHYSERHCLRIHQVALKKMT